MSSLSYLFYFFFVSTEYLYGYRGPIGVKQRKQSPSFEKTLEAAAKEMGYSFIDSEDPDKLGTVFSFVPRFQ